jgi:hypothetical protein
MLTIALVVLIANINFQGADISAKVSEKSLKLKRKQ